MSTKPVIYTSHHECPVLPETDVFHYLLPQKPGDSPIKHYDPNLPAFIDGATGRCLSRADVEDGALRILTGLRNLGLKRTDSMCIWSLNSLEWELALFGTMALGLTLTPANPHYSPREVAHQMNDSRAVGIFIDPALLPLFEKARKDIKMDIPDDRVILLCDRFNKPAGTGHKCIYELYGTRGVPDRRSGKEIHDTAYLCYSSGTTGLPKGVMTTHHNITTQCQTFAVANEPLKPGRDAILCFVPLSHVYGLSIATFQGFSTGITLVLLPRFDEVTALSCIEKFRISHMLIVPPVIITLLQSPHFDSYDTSSLRSCMSAAAPLSRELAEAFRKKVPTAEITQGYGLTETSPIITTYTSQEAAGREGQIGRMIPSYEVRLITSEGRDAATGEPGEMWVRGPNVMKGYHANPEATKNTFEGDWFKTGDVIKRDNDGWFTVVDRVKELIKFKGFQVPPAEIEGLLLQHPKVADVGVVGVYDESRATEVVRAYVVPTKAANIHDSAEEQMLSKELSAWVAARVAHYKRLSGGCIIIDAIPKTGSGKILRKDLRARAKAEHAAEMGLQAKL